VRDGNDVPADMQPFLGKHAGVGLKALFIVHGMIDQGKRRCIVYAENSRDYLAFKAALPEACRLHGVHCCVEGVHMRQAPKNHPLEHMKCSRTDAAKAKKTFSEGKTLEYRTVGGDSEGSTPRQEERVVLHFMVSMFVFDMCVNVPECDSIFIASPPKTPNEQSAILALQRAGRAWRKRDGKHFAAIFVFAEASSQFADALLDRLFDDEDLPGRLERVRQRIKKVVRSLGANSDEVAEPARVEAEKASIELLHERFKFHPSGSGFDALKKHRENQSAAIVDGMREVVHDDETTYVTRSQMPVDTADDELKAGALWGRVKKGIAEQKDKATRELGVRAKEIWEELDGRGWGWTKEEFYAFADAHFKNKTTDDARLAGMLKDAAPTPRQICACFSRMLLGLNYLNPRAADEGKAVEACCASWIAYRDAQRAKFPNTKPDVEPLPPDTAEAQWRKWLAWPDALTNLDLEEDELWIAVGYLQLKGKNATAHVPGRPAQGRVKASSVATCAPCQNDARKPATKETQKHKKARNTCSDPFGKGCTGISSGSRTACPDCQREKKQRKAARST
jgi:hypothetical protein